MNDYGARTRRALLDAGRRIFAERGYRGASIRAITTEAGANLGAVTYHFGTKIRFYEEILADTIGPLVERLETLASDSGGAPMERIQQFLATQYRYLNEHEELRRLILQQLVSGRETPQVVRGFLGRLVGTLSGLIREAQSDGVAVSGDPRYLALCAAAGPIWINMVQRPLSEAVGIDQTIEGVRAAVVQTLTDFVARGLGADAGGEG